MSRPVHIRRVRASRRIFRESPFQAKADDRPQVRALCGAWVAPCEAVRADASPVKRAKVTCDECREVRT
ncbi:MAG TPA: hypothetical protein VFT98_03625 [Myxococcota bacterium]|nr:hypothetical protein [Myxococcota bacterium]